MTDRPPCDRLFNTWVRDLRRAHGLTQTALAHQVGCAAVTIRHLEAGRLRPSAQIIERLIAALALPAADQAAFRVAGRQGPDACNVAGPVKTGVIHSVLPRSPWALIGRATTIMQIAQLLTRGDSRLVTLAGPAGVGKTSVAVAVAQQLAAHWRDGVVEVALESVRTPDLVLPAIMQATHHSHHAPPEPDQWSRWLAERELLLVLDNLEQVIAARSTIAHLSAAAPQVRWLITSRIHLDVYAETVVPLEPLACPPVGDHDLTLAQLTTWPAAALFLERARPLLPPLADAHAPVIAAICRQIDGIPLALELAAARCRVLSLGEVLRHLADRYALLTNGPADRSDRQRTLHAAVDWSYSLLTTQEKAVLMAASVFMGGWTLDALAAVYDPQIHAMLPLIDVLNSLIQQSLVNVDRSVTTIRYQMLDTIREFARDQLQALGHHTLYERHATYYLQQVTRPSQEQPDTPIWLDMLDREQANLRAALQWWLHQRRAVEAVGMACALGHWWNKRGAWVEGRQILEQLQPLLPDVAPITQARALNWLASYYLWEGNYRSAVTIYHRSLVIFTTLDDHEGMMRLHNNLGLVAQFMGDHAAAEASFRQCITMAEHLRRDIWIAASLNLSALLLGLNRIQEASMLYEDLEPHLQGCHDRALEALFLLRRGEVQIEQQAWASAERSLQAGLTRFADLRQDEYCGEVLHALSRLHQRQGQHGQARDTAYAALLHYRRVTDPLRVLRLLEHIVGLGLDASDSPVTPELVHACALLRIQLATPRLPGDQACWETMQQRIVNAGGASTASVPLAPWSLEASMRHAAQWLREQQYSLTMTDNNSRG